MELVPLTGIGFSCYSGGRGLFGGSVWRVERGQKGKRLDRVDTHGRGGSEGGSDRATLILYREIPCHWIEWCHKQQTHSAEAPFLSFATDENTRCNDDGRVKSCGQTVHTTVVLTLRAQITEQQLRRHNKKAHKLVRLCETHRHSTTAAVPFGLGATFDVKQQRSNKSHSRTRKSHKLRD